VSGYVCFLERYFTSDFTLFLAQTRSSFVRDRRQKFQRPCGVRWGGVFYYFIVRSNNKIFSFIFRTSFIEMLYVIPITMFFWH